MRDGPFTMLPWAATDHFEGIRNAFRGPEHALTWREFWLSMLTVGAFGILLYLVRWLSRRPWQQPYNAPSRLFRELCRAHRLTLRDRWFLRRLAHRLGEPAARIFVDPGLLDSPRHKLKDHEGIRRDRLRERLFGLNWATPPQEARRPTPSDTR